METSLGALNCEYRAAGAGVAPGPLELEHDLRTHFAPALETGIALALSGDPTVYVIRRVDCELTLRSAGRGLPEIARRTAGAVTNAVLRALTESRSASTTAVAPASTVPTGKKVATFADEAEFLAQFLVDLIEDRAHSRWYYASFGETLASSRQDALASLLSAPGPVPMRALGRIFARGYFERLLSELPASTRVTLADVGESPSDDVLRPLVNAALTLVGEVIALGLDREQLLREYAGTGPSSPDWRDRGSLAAGVLAVLEFLVRTERLQLTDDSARARIAAAAGTLDWLDAPTLLAGIERLRTGPPATPSVDDGTAMRQATESRSVPAGPPSATRLSHRQRLILRELAGACASGWPELDVRRGDCAENRLRLRAALTAHRETWADDMVAGELIGAVLRELSPRAGVDRPLLRELAAFGHSVAAKSSPGSVESDAAAELATYSEVAGVALLVRAALELRIPSLASAAGFLTGGDVLAASLGALAGAGSLEPDPALRLIFEEHGRSPGRPIDESARHAFESRLLRALAARGLLDGDPRVVATELGGVKALFGGIELPAVWPLTQIVRDSDEVEPTLARWREQWSDAVADPDPWFHSAANDGPLTLALAPLLDGRDVTSSAELTMIATGLVLVRVWGRWLSGLGRSSLSYLLDHFIRRPGTVSRDGERVDLMLERKQLDAVLELSGALAEVDARRTLGVTIHFELTAP